VRAEEMRAIAVVIWLVSDCLFGQTPVDTVAPPSKSATPVLLTMLSTGPQRLTNVMDRYPQLSRDGTQLVFDSNRSGTWQIYIAKFNRSAAEKGGVRYSIDGIRQIAVLPYPARCPAWSPDMKKIAFAAEPGGHSEIFVMDADGSHIVQLTHSGADDSHPHWSVDGSRIMFNSSRTMPSPGTDPSKEEDELFSMKPDGSDVRQHTHFRTTCTFGSFSPDMKKIAYRKVTQTPGMQWDLSPARRNSEVFVADADGTNDVNISKHPAFDGWPMWSPDGRTIAFASNRAGPANVGQVFFVNPDGSNLRPITNWPSSFVQPSWSPDGRLLFVYENRETADYEYGNISVVDVPTK